jgi:hypothetical protein
LVSLVYLVPLCEKPDKEVVGGSLKPRMTADIVTGALTMA